MFEDGELRRDDLKLTLTQAARAGRGKYPGELLTSAPSLGLSSPDSAYVGASYDPELHPLDAEWYFSKRCSIELASMLKDLRTCLLGTPTVAAQLQSGSFTLVDSSPYLTRRLPKLNSRDVQSLRVEDFQTQEHFEAVFLDPPWYFPELEKWLMVSARLVGSGGRIFFPLLGENTRPSAANDRARVLDRVSGWGRVVLHKDVVEYDIPLFEHRALAAEGIYLSAPWRRADLAVISVADLSSAQSSSGSCRNSQAPRQSWDTFQVGPQVVKVRKPEAMRPDSTLVTGVPGVRGYTLDTVSRRDSRLAEVDVWTSRNRVASTGDIGRLRKALAIVEQVPDSSVVPNRLNEEGFSTTDVESLLDLLEIPR